MAESGAANRPPLCGVVVAYHPSGDAVENLRAMVRECGSVVVVDNGSTEEALAPLAGVAGATILRLGANLGIATALNRGAEWARARGFGWCVAFDQDSRPVPGMIAAMWETHRRYPQAAIVAPTIREAHANPAGYCWVIPHSWIKGGFRRVRCAGADLDGVTMAISSGTLFELETWSKLGGFDEALFIDYVDVDYCLRVLRAGRRIVVSAGAVLDHRLGNRWRVRFLGREIRPMGHAAFRHYYIARNRCRLWKRHALAVQHWALFDLCFAGYNTLRVLGFEPDKMRKLRAMIVGTWDGLRGRSGPCPAHWLRGGG